jgi:hypothetical protein
VLISLHNLLREEVADGLIPGVRDYDAMIETVIGFYDNKTIWMHMKRIFINLSLNLILFICLIFVPLHFGHILFPFTGLSPLKFQFASKSSAGTELERSVELLVSHMLLPFLVERSQGNALDKLLRAILGVGAQIFKVSYLLNPHAFPFARVVVPPQDTLDVIHVRNFQADTGVIAGVDQQVNESELSNTTIATDNTTTTVTSTPRPFSLSQLSAIDIEKFSFEFRICGFVLFVMVCLSVSYSAALHITLTTGRFLVSLVDATANHDANNLCVGVAACGAMVYAGSFIARDFRSMELWNSIKAVFHKWGRIGLKLTVVSLCGLSVPPLLVGILNEAILLNPLTIAHDETPSYPIFRSWALGIIILKGWIK